jgi:hypothetical protein
MQVEEVESRFGREGGKEVRFMLAVNKADLLPSQATLTRLEVRHFPCPVASWLPRVPTCALISQMIPQVVGGCGLRAAGKVLPPVYSDAADV